ncbi:MAG: hypothetical protein Q6368_010355 [Candidatus Baldrarchaeota archaeon]|nr:hypothetical protein [Candidatus Baldrarchaeota archaeon]
MSKKIVEELAEKIANSLPVRSRLAIIGDTGQVFHSTLTSEAREAAEKIAKIGLPLWDVGDYQVKRLKNSQLLVYKITNRLALALDSVEREGVLILAAKKVASMFNNELNKLEELLGTVPTYEVEKPTLPSAPLKTEERKTTLTSSTSPTTPPSTTPSATLPSVKPAAKFETVNIPVLVDKGVLKKVKDDMVRSILELCDGSHTTSEIAKKLNIPRSKVLIVLGNFSKAINYISSIRKVEE